MKPSELCRIDKMISEIYARETHVSPTTVSEKETEKLKIIKKTESTGNFKCLI